MSPLRRARVALLVVAAPLGCATGGLAPCLTASAAASVEVTATPALSPAFSPSVKDYVSRCVPGKPVTVLVHATDGDRAAVAGSRRRGGTFQRQVTRASGAAFAIRVTHPGGTVATYHVRCLPPGFPGWSFYRRGRSQAAWYVITPIHRTRADYITIVDSRGTPIWWWRGTTFGPIDGKLLPDGTLAWARWYGDHFGVRAKDAYEIRRPDGSLVRLVRTVGSPTDTHELQLLPNGHYLVDTFRRRCCDDLSAHGGPSHAEVFDGEIQEIAPDGRLVWKWNTKNHVPLSWMTGDDKKGWWYQELKAEPRRPARERAYDIVHLNSVQPDGHGGLIVSARHLDSVFRIDRRTGNIDWKLGGTYVAGKSLTVLGPHPNPVLSGQHDARLWKDGSLTVYDNGTWWRPPSADRFAIDPIARTARLVERITNPAVTGSKAIGSARKLPGGDWLVDWGANPLVTEQRPDGAIVRRLYLFEHRSTYRAIPIEPGGVNPAALRRGMDHMNQSHRGAARETSR